MIPVIVFAKAPHPGKVKTRLIPALGAMGAATLHERLVQRTLATATSAGLGPVELCCAPNSTHEFFAACAAAGQVALTAQGPGDLGERMHRAAVRAIAAYRRLIIIGADCPAMNDAYLRAAGAALAAGCDAVVGPADDGGYVLIGLARVDRQLFADVEWGGPSVMSVTAARIEALGWRWRQLAPLWDVDRPEDLQRLRSDLADGDALLRDI